MKYAPFGMHHGDAGYDTNDAELTERQRAILEFPRQWFNEPPQLERQAYGASPWLTQLHPQAGGVVDAPPPLMDGWSGPGIKGYSWGAHRLFPPAEGAAAPATSAKL
jgi:hypothetical protein